MPVYLKNPHGSKPPEDEEVYIKFNEKTGTVSGFAGVNTFSGPYRVSGPTGIKVGPLATTRMYGPAMDYETMFLSVLNRADTILIIREMLFLYEGTEIVAALQAMYY